MRDIGKIAFGRIVTWSQRSFVIGTHRSSGTCLQSSYGTLSHFWYFSFTTLTFCTGAQLVLVRSLQVPGRSAQTLSL
jgi:hypothetical protein